jgi:hypothetical protein
MTVAKTQCQILGAAEPTILVYKQDAPARESEEDLVAKAELVSRQIVELLSGR